MTMLPRFSDDPAINAAVHMIAAAMRVPDGPDRLISLDELRWLVYAHFGYHAARNLNHLKPRELN